MKIKTIMKIGSQNFYKMTILNKKNKISVTLKVSKEAEAVEAVIEEIEGVEVAEEGMFQEVEAKCQTIKTNETKV